jgi:hypothetical protein
VSDAVEGEEWEFPSGSPVAAAEKLSDREEEFVAFEAL